MAFISDIITLHCANTVVCNNQFHKRKQRNSARVAARNKYIKHANALLFVCHFL